MGGSGGRRLVRGVKRNANQHLDKRENKSYSLGSDEERGK